MAGPDGGVIRSSLGGISHGSCYPSVTAWEVLRASLKGAAAVVTSPDDHRSAAPNRGLTIPFGRCISGSGSCPTIRVWIVSATSVHTNTIAYSTPDNHFTASPYRC